MEDAFKCFGNDDFDVKRWVNDQVRSSESLATAAGNAKGSSVDDHLSTLVVKLQLMAQSSSKSIDEHSTVFARAAPPQCPDDASLPLNRVHAAGHRAAHAGLTMTALDVPLPGRVQAEADQRTAKRSGGY